MEILTAVALLIASYVITMAFMPKAAPPAPAAFEEFQFPQVDEGTPQAVYFGECWSSGWMVLALGDFETETIEKGDGKK